MGDIFELVRRDDTDSLVKLLKAGLNVNEQDDLGRTALHISASHGFELSTKLLLEFGADHSLQDYESGWTALHRSLYFQHLGVSLLLVKAGAKLGDESRVVVDWKAEVSPKREARRSIVNYAHWKSPIDHDGYSPLDLLSICLSAYLHEASSSMKCSDIVVFGKADLPLGVPLPNSSDIVQPRRIEPLASCQVVDIAASKYHSVAVTKSGELYSWGHGRVGRLGHGDENSLMEPKIVSFFHGKRVRCVALAENHSLCSTEDGIAYSWGSNKYGQLGLGNKENMNIITTPRRIEGLKKVFVLGLAAGTSHSVCFSDSGEIFTWGSSKNGQLGLRASELVSMGGAASSGVYTPHRVLLYSNSYDRSIDSNTKVTNPMSSVSSARRVLQVSASCFSTLVLTRSLARQPTVVSTSTSASFVNEVVQWGHGAWSPSKVLFADSIGSCRRSSQGALDDNTPLAFSHKNMPVRITQVSAGRFHNVALSSAAHVYTWGLGSDQLGHGPLDAQLSSPLLLEALLPENGGGRAVYVSAANNHTCVVTETGDLYTWGASDDKGVLGHGMGKYQPVPKRVVGIKKAVRAVGGDDHTLVLTAYSVPTLPYPDIHFDDDDHEAAGDPQTQGDCGGSIVLQSAVDDMLDDSNGDIDADLVQSGLDVVGSLVEGDETVARSAAGLSRGGDAAGDGHRGVPTLKAICERRLATFVDIRCVVTMSEYADTYHAPALTSFCNSFIKSNLDAILVHRLRQGKGRSYTDQLLSRLAPVDNRLARESLSRLHAHRSLSDDSSGAAQYSETSPDDIKRNVPRKASFDGNSRRERSCSQDYESIEGLTRIVKSLRKKLLSISALEERRLSGHILTEDQLEKIERKAALERELHRVEPLLLRMEMKQTLLAKREVAPADVSTVKCDELHADVADPRDDKYDASCTTVLTSGSVSLVRSIEPKQTTTTEPPSFAEWMIPPAAVMDTKPDEPQDIQGKGRVPQPTNSLVVSRTTPSKKSRGKGKFVPLQEYVQSSQQQAASQFPSTESQDHSTIPLPTAAPTASVTSNPSPLASPSCTPTKLSAWGTTPLSTPAKHSPMSSTPPTPPTKTPSGTRSPVTTDKSTPPHKPRNIETSSLANFIVTKLAPPTPPACHSPVDANIPTKKSSVCPWMAPNAKTSPLVLPPTPAATTVTASTPVKSILDIQNEEEDLRRRSDMPTLAGHDSPWFVERRVRADSFEHVVRLQREEAMAEELRRREEQELREALAAVEEAERADKALEEVKTKTKPAKDAAAKGQKGLRRGRSDGRKHGVSYREADKKMVPLHRHKQKDDSSRDA